MTLPLESRDRGSIQCFAKSVPQEAVSILKPTYTPPLAQLYLLYSIKSFTCSCDHSREDLRSSKISIVLGGVVVLQLKMMESTWLLSHPPPRPPAPSCLTSVTSLKLGHLPTLALWPQKGGRNLQLGIRPQLSWLRFKHSRDCLLLLLSPREDYCLGPSSGITGKRLPRKSNRKIWQIMHLLGFSFVISQTQK